MVPAQQLFYACIFGEPPQSDQPNLSSLKGNTNTDLFTVRYESKRPHYVIIPS
jgi:hypothetical protein